MNSPITWKLLNLPVNLPWTLPLNLPVKFPPPTVPLKLPVNFPLAIPLNLPVNFPLVIPLNLPVNMNPLSLRLQHSWHLLFQCQCQLQHVHLTFININFIDHYQFVTTDKIITANTTLYFINYWWQASEASETLSGLTNGNWIYKMHATSLE